MLKLNYVQKTLMANRFREVKSDFFYYLGKGNFYFVYYLVTCFQSSILIIELKK